MKNIIKVRSELNKKIIDEENLSSSRNQLEKNYENLNNQIMVAQSNVIIFVNQLESVLNEIKFNTEVKNHIISQIERIKDVDSKSVDSHDMIKKISEDMKEKLEKLQIYNKKVQNDVNSLNKDKANLGDENKKNVSIIE